MMVEAVQRYSNLELRILSRLEKGIKKQPPRKSAYLISQTVALPSEAK